MALERQLRPNDRELTRLLDELARQESEVEVPGKATLAERVDQLSQIFPHRIAKSTTRSAARPGQHSLVGELLTAAPKLEFSDCRALALRDVLSRLRNHRRLQRETLAAADPHVALRIGRSAHGARATLQGQAMWGAANQRAVTLYRRATAVGIGAPETQPVADAVGAIGTGVPLPVDVRRNLEAAMKVSLESVRLHTGSVARDAANAVNAEAFTVGEDIFFPGYDPLSSQCQETLAHEVVHCIQWRQGRITATAGGHGVSRPDDPLEREAESKAKSIVAAAFPAPVETHSSAGGRNTPVEGMRRWNDHGHSPAEAHRPPDLNAERGRARGFESRPSEVHRALTVAAFAPTLAPSSPHMLLRKAKPEHANIPADPSLATTAAIRSQQTAIVDDDPTLALTITPGAALAMERPHYGEATVRVTRRTPQHHRYMVLVSQALRENYDAAWLFSELRQVPTETVNTVTASLQASFGVSQAEVDAGPKTNTLGFWLPATKDGGATLYFSATGVYLVVALPDNPKAPAVWNEFVVRPNKLNEFEAGVVRGIYNTGALFASGLAAMARGVGAGKVSEYLVEEVKASLQNQAAKYPAKVQTIDEALTGIGPFLSYTAAAIGEQVPTLIGMIIGGGVGRVLADAVAKTAATYMGKSLTQHQAAQLALKASATWKFRGTFLGAFGVNAELQTGEIYSDLLEIQGLEESQRAVLTALLGGVVGGFLETLVPFTVARMWGLGGPFLVGLAKRIAAQPALASQVVRAAGLVAQGVATVVAGAGVEGLTEVAQGEIGNLAKSLFDSHFSWTSSETVRDRKENFAKAFIVGGAMGGAGHAGQLVTGRTETSTTAKQTTASADPTVLQTARDKTGAFHVTPEARAAAAPQSGTTGGDALQKNDKGYYEVPSGSSKVTRPGSKVRSFDPGGSKLEFEDGMVMDTRYAWALVGNEPYVVIGVDTGSHIGWLRSPKGQQVVSRLLAAITFVLPFAGGSHSGDASIASPKRWEPISRLPENLQKRLSAGDRALLNKVTGDLQHRVEEQKLNYIPVFGYLSLRHDNYRELGMKDQSEVVFGTHVEKATLDDHAIDVVASTVFRGTPEHPGVVAGLSKKPDQHVPGVMLKIPLDRAEELLAVLYAREFFAESDLRDRSDKDGNAVSNAMYAPAIETITVGDGKNTREVPALVFRTNPDGAKFLGDLTTEQLAHLMAAQGGFVDADGKTRGGATLEYWLKGYINARTAANEPIDPRIAAAVELAPLFPTLEVLRQLSARNDPAALRILEALRLMFQGAASPLALRQEQAPGPAVTRPPRQEAPADLEDRLYKRALELKELHPGDFDLALEAGAGKALTQLKSQAGVRTNMDTPGRLYLHPVQDANGFTSKDPIGHIQYHVTQKGQLVIIDLRIDSKFPVRDGDLLRDIMLTELKQKYPNAELTYRNRDPVEPTAPQHQSPASRTEVEPAVPQYGPPASRAEGYQEPGVRAETALDMSESPSEDRVDPLGRPRPKFTEAKRIMLTREVHGVPRDQVHKIVKIAKQNGLTVEELWDIYDEHSHLLEPVRTSSVFTKGQREEITAALEGKTGNDFDIEWAAAQKNWPGLTREMFDAWSHRTFTTLEKRIMCEKAVRTGLGPVIKEYGVARETIHEWAEQLGLSEKPRRYNQRGEELELEILRYYDAHGPTKAAAQFNTNVEAIVRLRKKHNWPTRTGPRLDPQERDERIRGALYWVDASLPMVRAAQLEDVSLKGVSAAHGERGIPTARQQFWNDMKAEALSLYSQGLTRTEIADKLALERSTVRGWIDRSELPQLTPEQRAATVVQGLELVDEGIQVARAAWILGLPEWLLRKANLKRNETGTESPPRQGQAVQSLETTMAKAFFLIDGGRTPKQAANLLGLDEWQVQYWNDKIGRGVPVRRVEDDQIAAALKLLRQGSVASAPKAAAAVSLDYQTLKKALRDIPDWKASAQQKEAEDIAQAKALFKAGKNPNAIAGILGTSNKRVTKWLREEIDRIQAAPETAARQAELELQKARAFFLLDGGMNSAEVGRRLGVEGWKVRDWDKQRGHWAEAKAKAKQTKAKQIADAWELIKKHTPVQQAADAVDLNITTLQLALAKIPEWTNRREAKWAGDKERAVALRKEGHTVTYIAQALNTSTPKVSAWLSEARDRLADESQIDPIEAKALQLIAEGKTIDATAKELGRSKNQVEYWYNRSFVKKYRTKAETEAAIDEGVQLIDAGVSKAEAARRVGMAPGVLGRYYALEKSGKRRRDEGKTDEPKLPPMGGGAPGKDALSIWKKQAGVRTIVEPKWITFLARLEPNPAAPETTVGLVGYDLQEHGGKKTIQIIDLTLDREILDPNGEGGLQVKDRRDLLRDIAFQELKALHPTATIRYQVDEDFAYVAKQAREMLPPDLAAVHTDYLWQLVYGNHPTLKRSQHHTDASAYIATELPTMANHLRARLKGELGMQQPFYNGDTYERDYEAPVPASENSATPGALTSREFAERALKEIELVQKAGVMSLLKYKKICMLYGRAFGFEPTDPIVLADLYFWSRPPRELHETNTDLGGRFDLFSDASAFGISLAERIQPDTEVYQDDREMNFTMYRRHDGGHHKISVPMPSEPIRFLHRIAEQVRFRVGFRQLRDSVDEQGKLALDKIWFNHFHESATGGPDPVSFYDSFVDYDESPPGWTESPRNKRMREAGALVKQYVTKFMSDNPDCKIRYEFYQLLRTHHQTYQTTKDRLFYEERRQYGSKEPFHWYGDFEKVAGLVDNISDYGEFGGSFGHSAQDCLYALDEVESSRSLTGSQKAEVAEFRKQLERFAKAGQ